MDLGTILAAIQAVGSALWRGLVAKLLPTPLLLDPVAAPMKNEEWWGLVEDPGCLAPRPDSSAITRLARAAHASAAARRRANGPGRAPPPRPGSRRASPARSGRRCGRSRHSRRCARPIDTVARSPGVRREGYRGLTLLDDDMSLGSTGGAVAASDHLKEGALE